MFYQHAFIITHPPTAERYSQHPLNCNSKKKKNHKIADKKINIKGQNGQCNGYVNIRSTLRANK
jgi:hypothetical protein